jgi:hypothetical protein
MALPTFNLTMRKRLTSLALVLLIGGSVYTGMPLHSNEQECNMPEMAGMDCCKIAAQGESITSEELIAQLCCALNCSQQGTTGSRGAQLPRPSVAQLTLDYPSLVQPPPSRKFSCLSLNWAHSPLQYSNPAYIRHLALLI